MNYKKYLPFAFVFSVCLWRYGGDFWHSKWAFMLSLIAIYIAWEIGRKTASLFAGLWVLWTFLMGIWVFGWYDTYYKYLQANQMWHFESTSEYSVLSFLMMLWVVSSIEKITSNKILCALSWSCTASCVLILLNFILKGTSPLSVGGFFDQGSMEGLYIAATYPLLLIPKKVPRCMDRWFWTAETVLPWVTLILLLWKGQASQPIVILLATTVLFFLISELEVGKNLSATVMKSMLAFFFVVLCFCTFYKINPNFFNDSNRHQIYKMAWDFWTRSWEFMVFGLGTGSWATWADLIQIKTDILRGSRFTFMHSDFAQVAFEQGIIGLFLCVGTGLEAFFRALASDENRPVAFCLFAYALGMIFQFPWHLPMHSFLGLFLLSRCLGVNHGTHERAQAYIDA